MGTPWDLAAEGYLREWVPRFVPYHADLVRELHIAEGQRVLVTTAGPGSEVVSVARQVAEKGHVRATDASAEMVRICAEEVARAGVSSFVRCEVADASDVIGGPWDAVVCSFGLWQLDDRKRVLAAWASALSPKGKVGIITWGPPDGEDPSEMLADALRELEPSILFRQHRINAERATMAQMWKDAGLVMVRHTVVRHTLSFPKAEDFVRALSQACTWRRVFDEIGAIRLDRVAAKFYDKVGGPDVPLSFSPAATLAIAALPGAEVELEARPSTRVPSG